MKKVIIYKHANYKDGVKLWEGRYNKNRLSKWGLHDAISSVRVPQGMQVTMYEHPNWQGKSRKLTSDTSWIGETWNDRISSLKVTSDKTIPRATVFEHQDYEGNSMVLEPGDYEYSDLDSGVGNDAISSAQVPEGLFVVLFEHAGFKGRVCGLTSDIRDLSQRHFNDTATCLRVYDDSQYEAKLRRGSTSPPIPKLTGYECNALPEFTEQVLVAEALIPFIYVNDPQNVPYMQATQSPYYRLAREEVWERVLGYHHPGVVEYKYRKRVKIGMTKSETNTVKKTLSVEITTSGGLGFKLGDFSIDLKRSRKVAKQLETTYSTTETRMEEREIEIQYDFPASECTVVLWMRRDIYTLKRWDDYPITSWSFLQENFIEGQGWPPAQNDGQPLKLRPQILRIK